MNIIRDEQQDGFDTPSLFMIPLLVSWGIKRCNIKDCKNNPTTIITNTEAPVFGLCESHYQEFKGKSKVQLNLEFQ